MNIDIREYLRINPISAHELALSQNDKDCFLLFSASPSQDGATMPYVVKTQGQLFAEMCVDMLGNLVERDEDGGLKLACTVDATTTPPTIIWTGDVSGAVSGFDRYVKRSVWVEEFKADVDERLRDLKEAIAAAKNGLLGQRLDYVGAVEIQSKLAALYHCFECGLGHMWLAGSGDLQGGADRVEVRGVVAHVHPYTKAEGLTDSFSTIMGGGGLLGDVCVGGARLVSTGKNDKLRGSVFNVIGADGEDNDAMTYPLHGENVVDWRNPDATHNNLPPSTNVFVRHCAERPSWATSRAPANTRSVPRLASEDESVPPTEGQYVSMPISELDDFELSDLSESDCILRVCWGGDGQMGLKRQTLENLLDVFADVVAKKLATTVSSSTTISFQELIQSGLDQILVVKSEFMAWLEGCRAQMAELRKEMDEISKLRAGVRPMAYVGRVIASTTDDVETKVVAKYGGRRWRRITNFLRGVDEMSGAVGKKFGEEYVCLRDSNVPHHVHPMKKTTDPSDERWMNARGAGEASFMVDVERESGVGFIETPDVKNVGLEYQMSPLERGDAVMALPHSNMPPHKEVYIWECVATTKEEEELLPQSCTVDWITGEGCPIGDFQWLVEKDCALGRKLPAPEWIGHEFKGWFSEGGEEQISPSTVVSEDVEFFARWDVLRTEVRFDGNGGTPSTTTLSGNFGDPIEPPDVSMVGHTFHKWTPQPPPTFPEVSMVCSAKWLPNEYVAEFDANGGAGGCKKVQLVGTALHAPSVAKTHHSFVGWTPTVPSTMPPFDSVYSAMWSVDVFSLTLSGNGGLVDGEPVKSYSIPYGSAFTNLNVEWEGRTFLGWRPQLPSSMPATDVECVAQWSLNEYGIAFHGNGGEPSLVEMRVPHGTVVSANAVAFAGWDLDGWWTDPEGGTRQSVPFAASTSISLYAHWTQHQYQLVFSANGGEFEVGPSASTFISRSCLYNSTIAQAGGFPSESLRWQNEHVLASQKEGWWTSPFGGASVSEGYQIVVDPTVLYAQWDCHYMVTFNSNGGRFPDREGQEDWTKELDYGDSIVDAAPQVDSVDGEYVGTTEFAGWWTTPIGPGRRLTDADVVADDYNVTVYARWSRQLDFVRVGQPIISSDSGQMIASGFDRHVYLKATQRLDFNQDFILGMRVATGPEVSTRQDVMGIDNHDAEGVLTTKVWNLEFGVGDNKFHWEALSYGPGVAPIQFGSACQANQWYYMRVDKTNEDLLAQYVIGNSIINPTDEQVHWNEDFRGKVPEIDGDVGLRTIYMGGDPEFLPCYRDEHNVRRDGYINEKWSGQIDLKNSFIHVRGYMYSLRMVLNVVFDANGGLNGTTITRAWGERLDEFPTPTWDASHEFRGWWTDPNGGVQVAGPITVCSDVTYYAHWELRAHVVTFADLGTRTYQHGQPLGSDIPTFTVAEETVGKRTTYFDPKWQDEDSNFVDQNTLVVRDMILSKGRVRNRMVVSNIGHLPYLKRLSNGHLYSPTLGSNVPLSAQRLRDIVWRLVADNNEWGDFHAIDDWRILPQGWTRCEVVVNFYNINNVQARKYLVCVVDVANQSEWASNRLIEDDTYDGPWTDAHGSKTITITKNNETTPAILVAQTGLDTNHSWTRVDNNTIQAGDESGWYRASYFTSITCWF